MNFTIQQKELETTYTKAIWALVDSLREGKQQIYKKGKNTNGLPENFGKTPLYKLTKFPKTKVNWLLALSNIEPSKRNMNLLPEHHYEVIGMKDYSIWLDKAEREGLDPVSLRRLVRIYNAKYVTPKAKKRINSWAKNYLLMERDLNKMTLDQRNRVIEHIKTKLNEGGNVG